MPRIELHQPGIGKSDGIFLGNLAQQHPAATQLHALAQIARRFVGAKFGFLGEAANSVGGTWSAPSGPRACARRLHRRAAAQSRMCCSASNPNSIALTRRRAMAAMKQAEFVVALSPYQHGALDYAHVLLPIAPFTETAGTFVSTEGRVQSFNGVVQPLGGNAAGVESVARARQPARRGGLRLRQQRGGAQGCVSGR